MSRQLFYTIIRSYTSFSDEEAERFFSFFRECNYKRNVVLLEEGKVAHEVFFIVKGGVRQYFTTENGDERTCNFAFDGDIITDLESFSRQSRASSGIIALEPTSCLVINCGNLVAVLNEIPAVAEFFRLIVESIAAANIRRTKSMLAFSPDRQFEELIQQKPALLQRVPQRYIAQYLGIAPESLSRIRKRLMEPLKS